MSLSSIFPYSLFFIFFLLVPYQCATLTEKTSANIINKTCEACAKKASFNISYGFCYSSLSAVPVSHAADLGGLGLITLELALDNASSTISSISGLFIGNDSATQCNTCLESCLDLYFDMSMRLVVSIGEFPSGNKHDIVYLWVSEIMQETSICEAEFKEKGDKSPITKENHDLSQLCGMVLCIMDLLSLDPNSRSRLSIN